MDSKKRFGLGLTSMVFGIIGLLTFCIFIGIIPCVISISFGVASLISKESKKGFSISGIACGLLGVVLFIPWILK